MMAHKSYAAFFGWLCVFVTIPGVLVFCFTNELAQFETVIPIVVVTVALVPFALAFSVHKDLSNVNALEGLTQNETARLRHITLSARRFVIASVAVLFIVVIMVVIALVLISSIKASYLFTAIAALGGAELYAIMILMVLQSNLGDFKTTIANRKKDLERNKQLRKKLHSGSDSSS